MHTSNRIHRSDLCLGFESASNRETDPCDNMKAVLENVEECASICAMWEWLLGLARRAKVVGDDREEGIEIGVYLLPEDVFGLRRTT